MASATFTTPNLVAFNRALNKYGKKVVPEKHVKFQKAIAAQLFRSIVLKNPVGNPLLWKNPPPPGYVGGRSRGNWQIGLNAFTDVETGRIDASGGPTISVGLSKLAPAKPYGVIWIYNNVPYIVRLENGWSTQAPSGMVGIALAELAAGLRP